MHMSRTIGRGVLWALTSVVRSQLKTFLILRRSGWQSLGTSLEHCLCTFSPQSARVTGQKVRRAWPCCLQRGKKTDSKRTETQSDYVCVSRGLMEGVSSGVKNTWGNRCVSVKLGGKLWEYLSHAAVCLWLCQSESVTLSASGCACQRACIIHVCACKCISAASFHVCDRHLLNWKTILLLPPNILSQDWIFVSDCPIFCSFESP